MVKLKNWSKNVILLLIACVMSQCKDKEETIKENTPISNNFDIENKCISRIIKADIQLGKTRNEATKTMSLSKSIDAYIAGIKALDFKNCPDPFEAAFRDHTIAWENLKKVTDNYEQLRGEMHEVFNTIKKENKSPEFDKLLAEVWSSWEMVEAAMAQF